MYHKYYETFPGMIHAGMGPSQVNTFLTECNLPPISEFTLKKLENKLTSTITEKAQQSCKEAQDKEKEMTTDKVKI